MFFALALFSASSEQIISASDRFEKITNLKDAIDGKNKAEIEKIISEFNEIDSHLYKNKPFSIVDIKSSAASKDVAGIRTKKALYLPKNCVVKIEFYKRETINAIRLPKDIEGIKVEVRTTEKGKLIGVDSNGKFANSLTSNILFIKFTAQNSFALGPFDFE